METLFPTFTQRLPKRKIPKKQSESENKKLPNNKDTVQGWQCKTALSNGDACKRTFYDKQLCIDHIKRDHAQGGGKICQVLVRKKKNNNVTKPKIEPKKEEERIEPVYTCRFCPGLYDTIDAFHVN